MSLYAIWAGPDETVTFAENDGPSDTVVANQTDNTATALTPFSSLNPQFSNPGYTFAGWNTEENGSGTSYADGENYSFSAPLVLCAQWTPLPTSTITFNDNGGAGSDPSHNRSVGNVNLASVWSGTHS